MLLSQQRLWVPRGNVPHSRGEDHRDNDKLHVENLCNTVLLSKCPVMLGIKKKKRKKVYYGASLYDVEMTGMCLALQGGCAWGKSQTGIPSQSAFFPDIP